MAEVIPLKQEAAELPDLNDIVHQLEDGNLDKVWMILLYPDGRREEVVANHATAKAQAESRLPYYLRRHLKKFPASPDPI